MAAPRIEKHGLKYLNFEYFYFLVFLLLFIFQPVDLSVDHKPTRPCEQSRVEANGGHVRESKKNVSSCFGCMKSSHVYGPARVFPGMFL